MSDFQSIAKERFSDWNYGHPFILAGFIRALKPEVVVEVGSYRGFAACHMANALKENGKGKLHCIDNWSLTEHVERYGDPRTHFEENIKACGVEDWIEIHQGDSSDSSMWPEKADLCYIDGWHGHNQCEADFINARKRGAILIALDDTENCVGPRLFVENNLALPVCYENWDILDIHSDNGMTIFMKKQPRRKITFSQELPYPNPGVDIRPLNITQQESHFSEAFLITGLDYSAIINQTEHDAIL